MAKILVLYYSMYGHIETMAHAVADGANRVDGVEVVVKRVPETMQAEAFAKAGGKTQNAPVATPQELAEYDAIIFGTPTRFGNMSGQMRTFLDQTGGLWASGALYGKIASVFSSTGTGGGGGEYPLQDGFGWTNGVTLKMLDLICPQEKPCDALPATRPATTPSPQDKPVAAPAANDPAPAEPQKTGS